MCIIQMPTYSTHRKEPAEPYVAMATPRGTLYCLPGDETTTLPQLAAWIKLNTPYMRVWYTLAYTGQCVYMEQAVTSQRDE